MRIGVTGGAGFLGRHVVRRLASRHEVYVVDSGLITGGPKRLQSEFPSVQVDVADIRDPQTAQSWVESVKPDVVVHLAAVHFIPQCEAYPALAQSTNVGATVSLVQACRDVSRLVVASTAGTYKPSLEAHSETDELLPTDVYSLTKIQMEQWVARLRSANGQETVVMRLFNLMGSGETSPHLLPEVIRQMKAGSQSLLLGDLSTARDYIWAPDAARAIECFATAPMPNDQLTDHVNVGSGRATTGQELLAAVFAAAGRTAVIHRDPSRLRRSDRPMLLANIDHAVSHWGWEGMSESLPEAVAAIWDQPDLVYL